MEPKKEKTYTKKQVIELLEKQVEKCASVIDSSNLSEYTAKKRIREAGLIEF